MNDIQTIDFEKITNYEELRKRELPGFAPFYLQRFKRELKSNDEIDIEVFTRIVEMDSTNGTKLSDQLYWCLQYTTRSDILQVYSFSIITKYSTYYSRLLTLIR